MSGVERRSPLPGQVYQSVQEFDSYDAQTGRFDTDDLSEAQVITSRVSGSDGWHKVVLDIDVPAQLIPSSTPGHHHLYIDVAMREEVWADLVRALAKAEVIEDGYANASLERGFTAVRLPWIKKEETK